MDVVFLGLNDLGTRVYEWLLDRDGTDVRCLLTDADQLDLIADLAPDVVVSVGFDHLVPESVLAVPDGGCLNLHPAYLPYNRGKSPNVWSIVEDTPAGVTLHYMDGTFDTGDVIARRRVETTFADTGRDLHRRLEDAGFDLFTDVWPDVETGTAVAEPQDPDAGTSHTTADFRELCTLDPDETVRVRELLDRLRALTFPPFDNAHLTVDGERYYVDLDVRREGERDDETPAGLLESY
jgi:methionyl-tRNA formyltransferase